ncbi:MAG: hypothetical protein AMJ76_01635 [Dehalococcoidia bacterium SM23_28_1]|nr:MAG: hypothetical protein AMJ76_01635 [Dehalococcoidia bacterium SM23_28_1]
MLIRASEAVRHNGYLKALEELWSLPEVEYVEPVSGLYDCVARVEAPIRLIFVVHKVMAKSWVERVHVLRVDQPVQGALETEEAQITRLLRQREIIKAYRAGLARPLGAEPELHPGHAGPAGAEEAWMARLKRQREIIKAYYQKRRAGSQAGPIPMRERDDLAKAA